ncbi:hypothetical protein KUV85_12260 [Nocardioides panacisoli]|uniref:hypothetical protein n=1 Tax=Nocardioides panacisoli TaxID=627624 RepID=UPI001C62B125|nr:hypothetical protein [Nocardioides panacisoli]QYJ03106.1 hypothetical protein KUV85_12260 [Nocardioides panacisoli]
MRRPDVPKDWLVSGLRWGIWQPDTGSEQRWIDLAEMTGYSSADPAERQMWAAFLRASQIQDAIWHRINVKLPALGYSHRAELAWDPEDPASSRRTQMSTSTLANIGSGQRFMTLKEIAQLEIALGTLLPLGTTTD